MWLGNGGIENDKESDARILMLRTLRDAIVGFKCIFFVLNSARNFIRKI